MTNKAIQDPNAALVNASQPQSDGVYGIRSKDGYWLTPNRTLSARYDQRARMDFNMAIIEVQECRKWNPSTDIVEIPSGIIVKDTKTVEGTFKPIEVTREEFITRWVSHFNQFWTLAHDVADYDALKFSKEKIVEMAGRAWDRLPIEKV